MLSKLPQIRTWYPPKSQKRSTPWKSAGNPLKYLRKLPETLSNPFRFQVTLLRSLKILENSPVTSLELTENPLKLPGIHIKFSWITCHAHDTLWNRLKRPRSPYVTPLIPLLKHLWNSFETSHDPLLNLLATRPSYTSLNQPINYYTLKPQFRSNPFR